MDNSFRKNKTKNKISTKKNNSGFSMIEALVGTALLSILSIAAFYGYESIQKLSTQSSTLNSNDNRVFEIVENIRANTSQKIISFPSEENEASFISETLEVNTLPRAWSLQMDTATEACLQCPGRYGYTVTAIPRFSGLYKVSIVMTHKEWPAPKNYSFMVTK